MHRIVTFLFAALIVSFVVAAEPSSPTVPLELATWGDPLSVRFNVRITSDNQLAVVREGLPEIKGGPTQQRQVVQLSLAESSELVQLALSADDFDEGCMTVADGTSAALRIVTASGTTTRRCSMAKEWPIGPKTKRFLDQLNSHLPKALNVY